MAPEEADAIRLATKLMRQAANILAADDGLYRKLLAARVRDAADDLATFLPPLRDSLAASLAATEGGA